MALQLGGLRRRSRQEDQADDRLPDDDRPKLRRGAEGDRFAAAHRHPQGGHAGELGARRRRHHRRLGVGQSLAELGRTAEALSVIRDLDQKMPTRLRDFILAARMLLEKRPAESIAAVGRVVASDFRDPEGLFYLSRHLAHLNETGAALDLFERVVAGGFFCFPAMARDPWLDSLRRKPPFTRLLRRAQVQHQEALAAFTRLGGDKVLGVTSSV